LAEVYNSALEALDVGLFREIALFVVVIFAVYLPWTLLVHAALRIGGHPIKIWPGRGHGANEVVLRKLGKQKYVLIQGVLLWGWPIFVAFNVHRYLTHAYLRAEASVGSRSSLIGGFVIWSAIGYCFGLQSWNNPGSWDFELDD
jgi:hypothetical protein